MPRDREPVPAWLLLGPALSAVAVLSTLLRGQSSLLPRWAGWLIVIVCLVLIVTVLWQRHRATRR